VAFDLYWWPDGAEGVTMARGWYGDGGAKSFLVSFVAHGRWADVFSAGVDLAYGAVEHKFGYGGGDPHRARFQCHLHGGFVGGEEVRCPLTEVRCPLTFVCMHVYCLSSLLINNALTRLRSMVRARYNRRRC